MLRHLFLLRNYYNFSRKEEFASTEVRKSNFTEQFGTSIKYKFAISLGQGCLGIVLSNNSAKKLGDCLYIIHGLLK